MTINRKFIGITLFIWIILQGIISFPVNADDDAYTHIAFEAENMVRTRRSQDIQTSFTVPFSIVGLRINASPQGKLAYLEMTDSFFGAWTEGYVVAKKERQPDKFAEGLGPDAIPLILHVCDQKGTDMTTIPLAQRYGKNYNRLTFYGENFIGLQFGGRLCPIAWETIVNIQTREIFSLNYMTLNQGWGHQLSPDGKTLFTHVSTGDDLPRQLLLNGQGIYPFRDKHPIFASDNPDEFDEKLARLKSYQEEEKKKGRADRLFYGLSDKIWSEDNKSFVLLEKIGPRHRLLKFDLDAIASNKPFEEYCKPVRDVPATDEKKYPYGGLYDVQIMYDSRTGEISLESSYKKREQEYYDLVRRTIEARERKAQSSTPKK